MTLLNRARLVAQKAGLDFVRYPKGRQDYQAYRAFTSCAPDVILDVGANDGGFARQCRAFGFRGEIASFEPGSHAFARLSAAAARDRSWSAHQIGLGARSEDLILHVAANAGASSSLLEMLPSHESAAPGGRFVCDEAVRVCRLDEWIIEEVRAWERIALKIDTQGFERQVLDGAGRLLRKAVVGIHVELSLVPLYERSWLWDEAVEWLQGEGFVLAGLTPGFTDEVSGRLLQFDGVFVRGTGD